ncbi:MAG TPA: alpha/beta hydrolase [Burkholderiaceae bacterium]|nr:alpha/beta hydrolase [Burkholderiaceae bacterium]
MAQVEANGLSFDVEDSGDRNAPVVLLIMGLGTPAALWPDGFVDRLLAAGLRVIRFDNRDCGHSTRLRSATVSRNLTGAIARALMRLPVRAPYTLDDMADDAAGLLTALGVARAHVVGASMGGMIAQVLAARHPGRVLSLVSIMSNSGNPSPRLALGKPRALRAILHRPRNVDDVQQLTDHLIRVFGIIGSPGYPSEPHLLRAQLERVALRGYYPAGTARQLLAILASGDRRPQLARITAPTLVIHGQDDPLVPVAAGIDTARHIRGARLEVIPGMGHDFPPALQPRITELIAAHVRGAEAASAVPTAA